MSEDRPLPLTAHLAELRTRLKRVFIIFIVVFIAGWLPAPTEFTHLNPEKLVTALFLSEYKPLVAVMFEELIVKALPSDVNVVTTGLLTPIEVGVNISLLLALLAAFPVFCSEMYQFVKRGLWYEHERKMFKSYLVASVVLFFLGLFFGYYVIFRILIRLYTHLAPAFGMQFLLTARSIINELVGAMLFSAAIFETPIIMLILTHLEVVKPTSFVEYRPIVYAVAIILICTFNPDPTFLSSVMWIALFVLLYEIGVFLSKRVYRRSVEKALDSSS